MDGNGLERTLLRDIYQSGSAARIASIGYSEEYPPDKSWLIIERAAKPVRKITYVMDLLGSVRFRDFPYKGWVAESTDEFEEMKLLTYSEAKGLYSQSRNLRFGQAGDRCLMNAIGFFHDGTGLMYLAVYRKNDEKGRVADIY